MNSLSFRGFSLRVGFFTVSLLVALAPALIMAKITADHDEPVQSAEIGLDESIDDGYNVGPVPAISSLQVDQELGPNDPTIPKNGG